MFEVKNSRKAFFLLSFMIFVLLAINLAVFLGIGASGKTWLIFLYISLPFLLMYIIGIVDYCYFKITVQNEQIIVRKTLRKKREYSFQDIKDYHHYAYKDIFFINFKDGKSLSITKYYTNHNLLIERIRQTGKLKKLTGFPLVLDKNKEMHLSFTIKQKKTSLILSAFYILFDVSLIFLSIFILKDDIEAMIFMGLFISFFVVATILCIVETFRFQVKIEKGNMVITPMIGKKRYYRLRNIINITGTPSGARIHFDDGKKFNLHYVFKTNIDLFIDLFAEIQSDKK